jgi:prevent-host-death family protein
MTEITATDASKRFADLLDAVEHRGESFTVLRRGRAIAVVSPAQPSTLGQLRTFARTHRPDSAWEADLAEIRHQAGAAPAPDPWRG